MNWRKTLTLSSAALAATLTYSQPVQATEFTGAEFLTWDQAKQDSFIEVSFTSIGVLLTQTSRPELASCLDGWYFSDRATINAKNSELKDTIRRNSQYHPSGVLVSVLRKQCGDYP